MNRRRFLAAAAGAAALPLLGRPARSAAIATTDLIGRPVALAAPARRVVLAQGRMLGALALIHQRPVDLLVGVGGDFAQLDAETAATYRAAFPNLDAVPVIGGGTPAGFSVERTLTLDPDLVIFPRAMAAGLDKAIALLNAAGIATAVVDFHEQPMRDTLPSLAILGALLDRAAAAADYAAFSTTRLAAIRDRIADAPRPKVFLHAHAGGTDCCFTAGRGTFTDLITAAGGVNIAAALLPGMAGQIGPETLLSADPDIYVATGGTHLRGRGGLVLGTGVAGDEADRSFAALTASRPVSGLTAPGAGRAHGLWQGFSTHPAHIVAIERLARWFHPDRLADLDADATLAEINRRFLAVPMTGCYWTA